MIELSVVSWVYLIHQLSGPSLPKLGIGFHCAFLASPTGLASKLISVSGSSCVGQAPSFLGLLRERPFHDCLKETVIGANYSDFDLELLFMQNTVRYFMSVQGFLEEQRTFFVRCVIPEFRQQVHFILKAFTEVGLAFIGTCLLKWEGAVCSSRVGKR